MKKMLVIALIISLGVSSWLVLRHHRRTTPADTRTDRRAVDYWQHSIRLETRADYSTDALPDTAREKLRQEELRQKPWEARN